MTPAPPTVTKLANPKSQLDIRLWGQIITISETLRRIISNLCATFRDFLELEIMFPTESENEVGYRNPCFSDILVRKPYGNRWFCRKHLIAFILYTRPHHTIF